MATMIDNKTSAFRGEKKVYDAIEQFLPKESVCYFNREIKGREFDFCILTKNQFILIIEVKGWKPSDVLRVESPDRIYIANHSEPVGSPKKQARGYRFALLNECQDKLHISPLIIDMVCYPFMTKADCTMKGLNIVCDEAFTIYSTDLADKKAFLSKLQAAYVNSKKTTFSKLDADNFNKIRSLFENGVESKDCVDINYSCISIFPNNISVVETSNIIDEYVKGTKQIVFTSNKLYAAQIVDNIEKKFASLSIEVNKGGLKIGDGAKTSLPHVFDAFSIFNFNIYVVDNLEEIVSDNTTIYNGNINESDFSLLKLLSELTMFNFQQYLVEHANVEKNIQVKAGAGTGKTYSMISRISYLCNQFSKSGVNCPADDIAMVTFTVEAASNMKRRLKEQFMNYYVLTKNKMYLDLVSNIERMRISTIHSFASDVFKKTSLPLGVGTDFKTISGDYDRSKILKDNLGEYIGTKVTSVSAYDKIPGSVYDLEKNIISFTTKLYNKGCDIKTADIAMFGNPPESMDYMNEVIIDVIQKTELEYTKQLIDNNSLQLQEYMFYLNKCIDHESFNPNNFGYKYFFIDEFQDVDDCQINAFLKMQTKLHFKFFIVGDIKQSIYRFRGATLNAFSQMGCDDPSTWESLSLSTNYRSDKNLLLTFDKVFSSLGNDNLLPYGPSDELKGIKLTKIPDPDLVKKIVYTAEETQENNDVIFDRLFNEVNARKSLLESHSLSENLSASEKTIAILVRKNSEIQTILNEAKKRLTKVESAENGRLYKTQAAIDLCKLTSALCNPYNDIYLFDLIMSNNVGFNFDPNWLVGKTKEEKKNILISVLDTYYSGENMLGKKWGEIIKDAQTLPILKVLRDIYEKSKPWVRCSDSHEKQLYYRANHDLLFENFASMNKYSFLTLDSVNQSLRIGITTGMDVASREVDVEMDGIRIICTTIHKSKGLEYDSVFLPFTTDPINVAKKNTIDVTFEDGRVGYSISLDNKPQMVNSFYSISSSIEETKKEESRILYVAMTRAINKFVWCKNTSDSDTLNWGNILEAL